jgi:hypothetical protein
VFHTGTEPEPAFRIGQQLSTSEEFHRQYARMPVMTSFPPRYAAIVWFRKNSSAVGFVRSKDALTIPAYFMNAFSHTTHSFIMADWSSG